jgi:hypothetical protein
MLPDVIDLDELGRNVREGFSMPFMVLLQKSGLAASCLPSVALKSRHNERDGYSPLLRSRKPFPVVHGVHAQQRFSNLGCDSEAVSITRAYHGEIMGTKTVSPD